MLGLLKIGSHMLIRDWLSTGILVSTVAAMAILLIYMLSLLSGYNRVMTATAHKDLMMILNDSADREEDSMLSSELVEGAIQLLENDHKLQIGSISYQLVTSATIREKTRKTQTVLVRGIDPAGRELLGPVEFLSGSAFATGTNEVDVGVRIASQSNLRVGGRIKLLGEMWTVAGIFRTGNAHDSEIWTDLRVLQNTLHLQNNISTIYLRSRRGALAAREANSVLRSQRNLPLYALSEGEYYQRNARSVLNIIRYSTYAFAILMGVGAMTGILTVMLAALRRQRQVWATVRALGFPNSAVVGAVLFEVMALMTVAVLVALVMVYSRVVGGSHSTLGAGTMISFRGELRAVDVAGVWAYVLLLGVIGSLWAMAREVRRSVATALGTGG